MTIRSLRLRILALAAVSTGAALILLWLLLTELFEQQIAARFFTELESHLDQLARVVEPDPASGVTLSEEPGDSRFARPFSGLYWQIAVTGTEGRELVTSSSLWDEVLALPAAAAEPGEIVRHERFPFLDTEVMAVERTLLLGRGDNETPIRLAVAIDRSELQGAKEEFGATVLLLVALLGAFLLLAATVQILVGLRPLADLRTRLNAMRAGDTRRLDGRFPSEVQGVVDELNDLLAGREEMVARARARAADLAHGLKTPLAVLAAESRRLAERGETAAAKEITTQIERMNRNVERELVRSRARLGGATLADRTPLGPAIDRLLRAFERMPGGDSIAWESVVGEVAAIPMDPADFDEVAGNLLDNARKWATGRVVVTATLHDGLVNVTIDDDGPGVPPGDLERVVERGRRLDESAPGSGLGLAIARDILELYGGQLELETAPVGGLRARISVPVADRSA